MSLTEFDTKATYGTSSSSVSTDSADLNLDNLIAAFRSNVPIRDRRYRLYVHRATFIGSEAVQWMLSSGIANTREDAINIGRLLQEAGIIEHCVQQHSFHDKYLFYRFVSDHPRAALRVPRETRLVSATHFLSPPKTLFRDLHRRLASPSYDQHDLPASAMHIGTLHRPLDAHNAQLLDHVRPASWADPSPSQPPTYDLLVLGSGPAGQAAASSAASVGARVALVEACALGGSSVNVACVPTQALLQAANLAATLRDDATLRDCGLSLDHAPHVDFAQTMRRVRRLRANVAARSSSAQTIRSLGVDIYFGRGVFNSPTSIFVNERTLAFRKAVIATGSSPALPEIPGLRDLYEKSSALVNAPTRLAVLTNETFFNLTVLPPRLGVFGSGASALELAQAMRRLGAQVTVFGKSGRVLKCEDRELANIVQKRLMEEGVTFRMGVSKFVELERTGRRGKGEYEEVRLSTVEDGVAKRYAFDAFLVCEGRRPNVTRLQLEMAGIRFDFWKGVEVDGVLQTSNVRVYGAGDCCAGVRSGAGADMMGRMAMRNALLLGTENAGQIAVPFVTRTSPELASLGPSEGELRQRGIRYRTFQTRFKDIDRAVCDGRTDGVVRVHVAEKTDEILAAGVVGEGAASLIGELTLAIQRGIGFASLGSVVHPYPTYSGAIGQTSDKYNKMRLTKAVQQLLRSIMKAQR